MNRSKNKTCVYAVYKRPALDLKRLIVRGWKKVSHKMEIKRKLEQQYSDKIDFKICYKRQRETLHNNQRINPRKRYNSCKYLFSQDRSTPIYKTTTNNNKRRNQEKYNNGGLQHPTSINGQTIQIEYQQRNTGLK